MLKSGKIVGQERFYVVVEFEAEGLHKSPAINNTVLCHGEKPAPV